MSAPVMTDLRIDYKPWTEARGSGRGDTPLQLRRSATTPNLFAATDPEVMFLLRLAEALQSGKRSWDRMAAAASVVGASRLFTKLSRGVVAAWLQDVKVGVGPDGSIAITAGSGNVAVHIEADPDRPTFVGIAEARTSGELIEAREGLSLEEAVEFLSRHLGN